MAGKPPICGRKMRRRTAYGYSQSSRATRVTNCRQGDDGYKDVDMPSCNCYEQVGVKSVTTERRTDLKIEQRIRCLVNHGRQSTRLHCWADRVQEPRPSVPLALLSAPHFCGRVPVFLGRWGCPDVEFNIDYEIEVRSGATWLRYWSEWSRSHPDNEVLAWRGLSCRLVEAINLLMMVRWLLSRSWNGPLVPEQDPSSTGSVGSFERDFHKSPRRKTFLLFPGSLLECLKLMMTAEPGRRGSASLGAPKRTCAPTWNSCTVQLHRLRNGGLGLMASHGFAVNHHNLGKMMEEEERHKTL